MGTSKDKKVDVEKTNKKTCFIVTPIGDPNSEIRRHIDGVIDASIIPALGNDYETIIPHRLYDLTTITKQIYQFLNECDLVIANLTGLNPNVMYELAVRFCIGKPVIIIIDDKTTLPFDVKDQRVIQYVNDSQGTIDLKDSIVKSLKKIDFSKVPSSPIHDALSEIALFKNLNGEESTKEGVSDKAISLIMKKLDVLEMKMARESTGNKDNQFHNQIDHSEEVYYSVDRIDEIFNMISEENNLCVNKKAIISEVNVLKSCLVRNHNIIPKSEYNYYMNRIGSILEFCSYN